MKIKIFTLLFAFLSLTTVEKKKTIYKTEEKSVVINRYQLLKGKNLPSQESFNDAMSGFMKYRQSNKIEKNIITIIDFNLSSTRKRLWVIDLDNHQVIYNTLVSHGKNTGDEFAKSFSNIFDSNKSSLGFYSTGEVYQGKHGTSLKLDGLEKGKNDNARKRYVVIHGADYVSENFIKIHHRLGRSQGCPALPLEFSENIINFIKNKSCVFIYYKNS